MLAETYYVIRVKKDGRYLTAHPDRDRPSAYLLLFTEQYTALSYLNTHAAEFVDQFATEAILQNQIKGILQRWGYPGVALVKDPLIPHIEFLIT